jgi:hypothetical protein
VLHGVQLTTFDHEVNFHLPRPGLILRDDILPALNLKVGYAAAQLHVDLPTPSEVPSGRGVIVLRIEPLPKI